jgi:adhesin/invasin
MVQHGLLGFRRRRAVFAGLLTLVGLAAGSCDKAPLTAPSGSAITLVASPAAIPANGAAEITAFVIEGALSTGTEDEPGRVVPGVGTPVHNGTEVFFTTTLGRIEPADAQTVAGRATARLIGADRSGTAIVRATSGGATSTIEVDIGAATATRLVLTATPQTLGAGGGTSEVSARVEDQQGNPVPQVLVSFSTSRGSLNPTSDLTSSQGRASTILSTTESATVTATSGGSATALSGTIVVTVTSATTGAASQRRFDRSNP